MPLVTAYRKWGPGDLREARITWLVKLVHGSAAIRIKFPGLPTHLSTWSFLGKHTKVCNDCHSPQESLEPQTNTTMENKING